MMMIAWLANDDVDDDDDACVPIPGESLIHSLRVPLVDNDIAEINDYEWDGPGEFADKPQDHQTWW